MEDVSYSCLWFNLYHWDLIPQLQGKGIITIPGVVTFGPVFFLNWGNVGCYAGGLSQLCHKYV